jgi:hypothetical protein
MPQAPIIISRSRDPPVASVTVLFCSLVNLWPFVIIFTIMFWLCYVMLCYVKHLALFVNTSRILFTASVTQLSVSWLDPPKYKSNLSRCPSNLLDAAFFTIAEAAMVASTQLFSRTLSGHVNSTLSVVEKKIHIEDSVHISSVGVTF